MSYFGIPKAANDPSAARLTDGTSFYKATTPSDTQPVSAASLPLPTGAGTSAKQDTIIGHLDGVEGLLTTIDADTGNVSTKIDTLAGAVSGTEMQVDVLTMPTVTVQATDLDVRNLSQAQDAVLIYGSDDGGTTKRVIKTDSGGAIQVDLEVANVTETNSGAIRTAVETLDNAISGSEMQVDIVASLPAGTNNIGDVDVLSSALPTGAATLSEQQTQTTHLATIAGDTTDIEAAVELIDDAIYTDGTGSPSKGIAVMGTDGTNPQLVKTDASGELQIDVLTLPAIPAGDNAVGRVKITDGTDVADVLDLTNSNPLTVAVVDSSGTQITSFGGGTQYTEADTDASITGTAFLWEDSGDTLRAVSSAKPLPIGDAGGSLTVDGTVAATQSGTWIIGANSGVDIGDTTINNASGASAVNIQDGGNSITIDGSVGISAGTNNIGDIDVLTVPAPLSTSGGGTEAAALRVTLANDSTGLVSIDDNGGSITVDGTVAVTGVATSANQSTQITAANATQTAVELIDDTVHTANATMGKGILVFGNNSTIAKAIQVDGSGNLIVASHAVTNAGTFATQENGAALTALQIMDDWDNGASDACSVSGDVAHDATDAGEPVKIGGRAASADPTAVATGDRANALFDLVGKLIVSPYAIPENLTIGTITTAMTGTTSTAVSGMGAPGVGLRNYITSIVVSNSHATVGTDVVLQDGSGGTVIGTFPAASVYGGVAFSLPSPIRQPTTNTGIFAANITTGASTKVTCYGYKGI